MTSTEHSWDKEVDLLVVGSGGGGMAAALRAHDLGSEVLLIEKGDLYGGSTAISGGVCWVGNNRHMPKAGIQDSDEETLTYLKHITKGEVAEEKITTYVRESNRVINYLHDNSQVKFTAVAKYTDYYPEAPGGKMGARSMECPRFNAKVLGPRLMELQRPHIQSQIMGKFGIMAGEAHQALVGNWRTKFFMVWQFIKYLLRSGARKRCGRDTSLTAGNSLMARFFTSLIDRNVEMWKESSAQELIIEDGHVLGALVEKTGQSLRIRARQGVVLAAGGFEHNQDMRNQYQKQPIKTEWNVGNTLNVGDGIKLGLTAGGTLDLMDEAWWTPICQVPGKTPAFVLVVEKSLPHGLFVNNQAKRFTNEAAPYIDVVHGIYGDDDGQGKTIPAWLIFDATFRQRFPVGPVPPGYAASDGVMKRFFKNGFLTKADSLTALAEKIDLDPVQLQETINRFNTNARQGLDPDFGRGKSASDRYYGDPRVKPNPCLGPVETAPFYAIRIYPGDLGTKGGLITDTQSRVLREDGTAIAGLYATGNCSASMMGRTYPGAGGTIGPAITFGFLAAEAAAQDTTGG
ncbi:3-oxosteroid 1-dehydrogenase-like [Ylistrum balloti]|uniref:3-oxosteroid 1-dehydrogenase-like n=1 Tax=Ylistrum balloti TaxID=509963 RepID=UPI0029059BDA|nr:3-oxosteroid 1-dehydrogenase-like [Ylistrum balloti]